MGAVAGMCGACTERERGRMTDRERERERTAYGSAEYVHESHWCHQFILLLEGGEGVHF